MVTIWERMAALNYLSYPLLWNTPSYELVEQKIVQVWFIPHKKSTIMMEEPLVIVIYTRMIHITYLKFYYVRIPGKLLFIYAQQLLFRKCFCNINTFVNMFSIL